ncbi:MAG: 30S ribosomal protein S2 [Chitinispirillales bacterium]|jgi:small subunit ribosomal protein S2|nr:30S ribosomal protein S2 [Chitinispirillales bacterium]
MSVIKIEELLEAGAHFGHQIRRWNPKMKPYILCERNGIHFMDLEKTILGLNKFIEKVGEVTSKGGKILFVGTKKQLKTYIREEAERCKMPFVTERWLGGMLTNLATVKESIRRLDKLEAEMETEDFHKLTKKEQGQKLHDKEKLLSVLGGIRDMKHNPKIVFVVDTVREHLAVAEARRLGIEVAAIADTNSNPDLIDYVIPANDDAIKSVKVITEKIVDAIIDATKDLKVIAGKEGEEDEAKKAAKYEKQDAEDEESRKPRKKIRKKAE